MNLKELKQTLNSNVGKPLKEYLTLQLQELRNIDNVKDCETPTHQAIELKAQKKAFEKVRSILEKIMTIEEMDDSKKEEDNYFA